MLQIPSLITAHVSEPDGRPVAGLLVYLNTFVSGSYYFGDVMGLTDTTGRVTANAEELIRHFAANRRMFMMDYKVDLVECDAMLGVAIAGGTDFEAAREQVAALDYVSRDVKEWYGFARNGEYASLEMRYDVGDNTSRELDIKLVVHRLLR